MVYNRDSLWFHLWTGYVRRVVEGRYEGFSSDEAFSRNTDGEDCPISRAYRAADFIGLAGQAGFEARFLGGYFARIELSSDRELRQQAIADRRLLDEHRRFLERLELDGDGYPMHEGKHAGVGGAYVLRPISNCERRRNLE